MEVAIVEFGKRKTDGDFIIHVSEEIGKLKAGYGFAERGFTDVLQQIQKVDEKIDGLRKDLYGAGPDSPGIFERIRSLTIKVGVIFTILCTVGAFLGQLLEKVIFK